MKTALEAVNSKLDVLVEQDSSLQKFHAKAIRAVDSAECCRLLALRKPIQADIQRFSSERIDLQEAIAAFQAEL